MCVYVANKINYIICSKLNNIFNQIINLNFQFMIIYRILESRRPSRQFLCSCAVVACVGPKEAGSRNFRFAVSDLSHKLWGFQKQGADPQSW
jgi:hypothetical protein